MPNSHTMVAEAKCRQHTLMWRTTQQCVLLLAASEATPNTSTAYKAPHDSQSGSMVHLQLGACCAVGPSAPCTPWALIPSTAFTSQVKLTVQSTLA